MSAPVLEPRSYSLTVGDKGRLVIPAEIRAAHGWESGTAVIAVDAPGGVLLLTLEEAMERIRTATTVSVDDFLAGRRAEHVAEEKEMVEWGAFSSTPRP
ncbi:MAG: AbrB/MazE/SpoVT family DNA-binding domain-containing protein [Actinomycetes bacterium]